MKIWVDADACPGAIKETIVRAANRLKINTVFVANKTIHLPLSPYLSTERVGAGLDVADGFIARSASSGDVAMTADIPLAAALVAKAVIVIDPRGSVFSEENIGEALAMRNFMHELREGGAVTEGPRGFGPRDAQKFAASLDQQLALALRRASGK